MNKKTGIFIPARLKSERLPQKLILPFGDSSLFEIACKKLNDIDCNINKYVLINDKELINIAEKYENIKIILRDSGTCEQEGPLQYIFKDISNVEDTHLMFLNPCLAFLKAETIEKTINDFNQSEKDYGTSVKPFHNWILNECGEVINDIDYARLTTKEIKNLYQFAHCFHIFNREKFFRDGMMLKDDFLPISVSEEETIDVDTKEEYLYANWYYNNGGKL